MGWPDIRYADGTEIAPQLDLRFRLELYAGVRPARAIPGVSLPLASPRARDIDLVLVRENTEGLFASRGKGVRLGNDEARDTMVITRAGSERVHKFPFELAGRRRAGEGKANPTATILLAAMMLDWLGERSGNPGLLQAAAKLQQAVDGGVRIGPIPCELGGGDGTRAIADAVALAERFTGRGGADQCGLPRIPGRCDPIERDRPRRNTCSPGNPTKRHLDLWRFEPRRTAAGIRRARCRNKLQTAKHAPAQNPPAPDKHRNRRRPPRGPDRPARSRRLTLHANKLRASLNLRGAARRPGAAA